MSDLNAAEIIAEHLQKMRSAGGKARAEKMSTREKREMSAEMHAAKRAKKALLAREMAHLRQPSVGREG